jgi:excisionase family DNA binding protein
MGRLLTAPELATRLNCSVKTVSRMVKQGCPRLYLHQRALRFNEDEVLRWLESQRGTDPGSHPGGRPRKPLTQEVAK